MPPLRAGLYLRVSTAHQAATGVSLEEQEHRLRAGAGRHDWHIAAVYRDDGYSGHSMDRPDVQRCLRDVTAGALDVVYILELERGHRNERDRHNFEHYLADHGVDLIYEAEPQYSRYSQRQAMRGLQGVMAQYYSDYISETVRDKMRFLAAVGHRIPNGRAPFGLRQTAAHRLEPDPEWWPYARQIFEHAIAGDSPYAIARWLQRQGVPTPGMLEWRRNPVSGRGRPKAPPKAGWHYRTVHRILANEAYHGVLLYGRRQMDRRTGKEQRGDTVIRIEDAWPRWVPDDVWHTVQAQLDHAPRDYRGRNAGHFALRTLRCGLCGAAVIGRLRYSVYRATGRTYIYHRYVCGTRNRGDMHCALPILDAPTLDRQVVSAVAMHLAETAPEATALRARALALLSEREITLRHETGAMAARLEALTAQRTQAAQALTMHQVAISEALLRELDAQVQALTGQIDAETARLRTAEAALRDIPAARVRLAEALRDAASLVATLVEADTAAQRRVLAQLVARTVLYPDRAEVHLQALPDPLIAPFGSE